MGDNAGRSGLRHVLVSGLVLASSVLAAGCGAGAGNPDVLYENALGAFESGDRARAAAGLEQLLRLRPPTPRDHGLRARLAMAENRGDEALAALAAIPDDDPLGPWARLTTGQLELRRNRLRDAEENLRAALRLDPELVPARRELIYILGMHARRRELDEALETLAAQSRLTYRETWIWCMVPDLIWWLPGEHVETLLPCLEADPDDRYSRLALAEDYRRLARYDDAEMILRPLPDDDADARSLRAQLALERGNQDATAALLAGGPPDHPALARLRGRLALAARDADEAVRQFRIAYEAEPDRRESHANLSRALLLAGEDEAAEPLVQAVQRYDQLATLLLRAEDEDGAGDRRLLKDLAAACEAVGRIPEARAWYALVVAIDPLDREAQQALYQLERPWSGEG